MKRGRNEESCRLPQVLLGMQLSPRCAEEGGCSEPDVLQEDTTGDYTERGTNKQGYEDSALIRLFDSPFQWRISHFTSLTGRELYSPPFKIGKHTWWARALGVCRVVLCVWPPDPDQQHPLDNTTGTYS
jgi:hypothetical protein